MMVIDLKKTYDKVSNELILFKLKHKGVYQNGA